MARNQNSVVIVDAVRTPIGRRNGGLSTLHPAELLGLAQKAIIERNGIDPAIVEQVVGGCVSQIGEQSFNVTRTAWLAAGLPLTTAATTVDTQCGSSQQATGLASSLIGIALVGIGSALDITCGLGPGPRDGAMTGIHQRTGIRGGRVRMGIEVTVLIVGAILGGQVGLGTALFALLIGQSVAISFGIVARLTSK